MRANQLRLWFAAMAYVLVCVLRRIALRHTQFAEATCGTIRLKLFKISALVRVSVRRIKVAMASASLPERVRPRPFAPDRRGALTNPERTARCHSRAEPTDHTHHDSLRLHVATLALFPCIARTDASDQDAMRNPGQAPILPARSV
jgi:Transposase DDE domain group 1